MKNSSAPVYIDNSISVTDEDIIDADNIQNDPEKMLRLIDLIFLCSDLETIPS